MNPNVHEIDGLKTYPSVSAIPGPVDLAIVLVPSHRTLTVIKECVEKGVYFSKVVSIGNACDLAVTDFLDYFRVDPETAVIGGYIEGIPNGPVFLKSLKSASLKKPVILWKVGMTPEGSRAAASHTGALVGSRRIWQRKQMQS